MTQRDNMLIGSWRTLASCASGVLLSACFPRIGWTPAVWICFLPLFWAVQGQPAGRAFRIGFICGIAHFVTLLSWLNYTLVYYGHIPAPAGWGIVLLLVCYLSLFIAVFAWWASRCLCLSLAWRFSIPVVWVALEFARSTLLSGFPWELLGNSLYRHLGIIQIADWFGVYGISFVVVLVNVAVYELMTLVMQHPTQTQRRDSFALMLTAVVVVVHVMAYGQWKIQSIQEEIDDAPAIDAMVVQGNIDQSIKWDPAHQQSTLEKYLRLSQQGLAESPSASRPDLVVWPETAAPFYMGRNIGMTLLLKDGIRKNGAWFLVGSPYVESENGANAYYNSAFLFDPEGMVQGRYDKAHLVPFGEYVPFQKWMPFIGKLVEEVGDFREGVPGRTLAWEGHRLGVLICYEQIFPDLARLASRNGADVLISMTNDAWYGNTAAPYQHFSMAVFRAIENRRSIIRAANTGISGFIDPIGRMTHTTALFEDAVSRQEIPLYSMKTIYTSSGDWFAWTCVFFAVVLAIFKKYFKPAPDGGFQSGGEYHER
jgi:apolipoprotein N-acyltransferase